MKPTRQQLETFLRGQKAAGQVIERERRERLRCLTHEQALADFEAFQNLLALPIDPLEKEALDRLHARHLVALRLTFDRVGKASGV